MPGQVRMVTRKTKGEPGLEATEVGAGAGGLKGTQPDLNEAASGRRLRVRTLRY